MTMNILYIHGLQSSGKSRTADILRRELSDANVYSPDIPVTADEAYAFIDRFRIDHNIDLIIGTSMGGMLAQKMRGIPKILVNPSFDVSRSMRKKVGFVPFYSERADGKTEYEITEQMCDDFEKFETKQFDNLSGAEIACTYGVFGTDDDVVDCKTEYLHYYSNIKIIKGGHRLSEENVVMEIVPLIRYMCSEEFQQKITDAEVAELRRHMAEFRERWKDTPQSIIDGFFQGD